MVKLVTYLVRVTTDDRSHRLWAAAACSGEEALTVILNAVPEGWTAAILPHRLKPLEIDALNLREGEAREISTISSTSATAPPAAH